MKLHHKMGGTSAIVLGLTYIAVAVLLLFGPQGENSVLLHAEHPVPLIAAHYLLALGAVAGFAVIPAVTRLLGSPDHAWLQWTTKLAYLGFALTAINNIRQASLDTSLAATYMAAEPAIRTVMESAWSGLVELSPQGVLDYLGLALWLLTVCVIGRRSGHLPPSLAWLGGAGALAIGLMVLGVMAGMQALTMIGMGVGGVLLMPAWLLLVGARMLGQEPGLR